LKRSQHRLTWRTGEDGKLAAFAGLVCTGITLGKGSVRLPINLDSSQSLELQQEASVPTGRHRKRGPDTARIPAGFGFQQILFTVEDGDLVPEQSEAMQDHWQYLVAC
jgi:hypothetical protein